jgi:hypothetical protein
MATGPQSRSRFITAAAAHSFKSELNYSAPASVDASAERPGTRRRTAITAASRKGDGGHQRLALDGEVGVDRVALAAAVTGGAGGITKVAHLSPGHRRRYNGTPGKGACATWLSRGYRCSVSAWHRKEAGHADDQGLRTNFNNVADVWPDPAEGSCGSRPG